MVRDDQPAVRTRWRFPHARGDGPTSQSVSVRQPFSPRAWGWSAGGRPCVSGEVFPTRVGMVRLRHYATQRTGRFPHARGDGPTDRSRPSEAVRRFPHARGDGPIVSERLIKLGRQFSPRAWGWSATHAALHGSCCVFPTRVGMVRTATWTVADRSSFPHARGDGPLRAWLAFRACAFSPRAWGWSVVSA